MTKVTDLITGLVEQLGYERALADTAGVSLDDAIYIADIGCA